MATEKVMELLHAIRTDPRAKEMLKGTAKPKSDEEVIRLCAELAPRLGFDVNEADIRDAFRKAERTCREKTDAAAEAIQKLSDDDATKVAAAGWDPYKCVDILRHI